MNIIRTKDYEEMSQAAFEVMQETLQKNPNASINTTTGATYDRMFELLVEAINGGKVSVKDAIFTNLDEYIADRHAPFTVYTYMHQKFYDLIKEKPKYIGLIDGSVEDIKAEIERFQKMLDKYPRDLQVLGLGTNAHLGANEPGTSFDARLFLADSDESTIESTIEYQNLSRKEAPTQMITLGLADIIEADHILVAASGEHKAKAVQEAIEGPVHEECPASILQTHPNVTFIIDEAAASLLI